MKMKIKWPSKKQWVQIFKVLNKKERTAFLIFLALFLGSSLSLIVILYCKNTEVQPAIGGKYSEGVVGAPRFINPIYAQGSDVDRDLVEIIFSGLMQYGPTGEIIPDAAKEVKIVDDGLTYEVYLKDNVFWHDGEYLTADDVIFTVKTIQNPDYKSPLRANYLGIEVEKINERVLRFKLKSSYSGFLERLTFKILPEHIWQSISPQNFLLTNYNLKAVGSGPYRIKKIGQDSSGLIISLDLVRFKDYFDSQKPYLSEINFRFFESEEALSEAAKKGEVDGFSISSPEYFELFKKDKWQKISLSLPRYFALFLNPDKSRFLTDENIRQALNYGTDKTEIVESVLLGQAQIVDSPILPKIYGFETPAKVYEFDQAKAEELLAEAGLEKKDNQWVKPSQEELTEFKSELKEGSKGKEVTALQTCLARDPEVYPEGKITGYFGSQTKAAVIKFQEKYAQDILQPWGFIEGTGLVSKTTRAKLNELCSQPQKDNPLKFSLITVADPILEKVGLAIKNQWESLGIAVEIHAYPASQLEKDFIKPRNYEILLFGEILEAIPDPYPFWHSSQIKDPGLNLAKYENTKADKLLEAARTTLDEETRAEKYEAFQDILIKESPAVFLYSPDYLYWIGKEIKGMNAEIIVDPSKRFANIENWYIKTHRSWK
ncbi:MAG: hypothetical protein COT59_00565 [Candidatus Nealsonbacteria bacterium CG09_land_8_20_14_0_10_42_14]|uniref:Solute-binding protein family 5 domain-containing protein n=1 Tax=Candidatus Nealsonbacteria bacterium CG09_land_8_20_14_0_10_42_14 TaxID=1974707 RepID=A0A2H0WZU6_9BACT|nr:MAG: hypothetical protein COT59_00565 [Candidatus Nealsonbacteria bacterium CG09_land_8_20_14_0_10_42_14]